MADERIYITEVKEGDVCPFEEKCEGFYKLCEGCKVLPTRQEAIEKMAKAICRTYGEDCETCRFNGNEKSCKRYLEFQNYIAMAEAALNALLEGHDDKK